MTRSRGVCVGAFMATTLPSLETRFAAGAGTPAELISSLQRRGYQVVGPTVRDGAIVYDTVESIEELPAGWTDEQEPGRYRLKQRGDRALFGYTLSPHSWKRFLHPPLVRLFRAERESSGFRILENGDGAAPKYALLGVRACELAAIALQDRVLLEDRYADPAYRSRREETFLVAVQCTQASSSCFCTSMGTGPEVAGGFDVLLTEVADGESISYVVQAGSERGAEVLGEMDLKEAPARRIKQAEAAVQLVAPLEDDRGRAGDDDLPHPLPHQELADDEARLDRLAQAHVVGDEQVHPGEF